MPDGLRCAEAPLTAASIPLRPPRPTGSSPHVCLLSFYHHRSTRCLITRWGGGFGFTAWRYRGPDLHAAHPRTARYCTLVTVRRVLVGRRLRFSSLTRQPLRGVGVLHRRVSLGGSRANSHDAHGCHSQRILLPLCCNVLELVYLEKKMFTVSPQL